MKINIIGAGPAGLFAGILIKRARPDADVRLFEQNSADATFGFGVVFSAQALAFLQQDDPETADLIQPHMHEWSDITVNHRDTRIIIDGIGFSAIARLSLLTLLQQRARQYGIDPLYNKKVNSLTELPAADLTIGADGLNSIVRHTWRKQFGEHLTSLQNRFVWYGCNKPFETLTQTFIDTPCGPANAHHYAYDDKQSTFIIEITKSTFDAAGFANMDESGYRQVCEQWFRHQLGSASLIPNHSSWRRFPILSCEQWYHDKNVLVGDALHTAHFSIGSGTRLALEDVIALASALQEHNWVIKDALPAFQNSRKPILDKITTAANASANWYEEFDEKMTLSPWPFALDYIRRAGRLSDAKLQQIAPCFFQQLAKKGLVSLVQQ